MAGIEAADERVVFAAAFLIACASSSTAMDHSIGSDGRHRVTAARRWSPQIGIIDFGKAVRTIGTVQ